ncbi:tryptophan synthase alpha chain-like isoform X1 [Canna indica]|uniref:Tryptophan synthase alpha chain-like isoform X1 n=1 Tax=Canna indica TaxID=4628 RepID=A0AAQ3KAQ6_9LILI|nr:tryptophan synthase alpha chain-like isoform X1 [Canna indica]
MASSSSSSLSAAMAVAANKNLYQVSSSTKPRLFCCISVNQSPPITSLRLRTQAHGISKTFSDLNKKGKVAFTPYITAGDPDLSTTEKALKLLSSCGANIIELGLPHTNPFMDGSVIQASHKRALERKINLQAVISMLEKVVPQISCPIVIFSYHNLILSQGYEQFLSALQDGGAKGLIVPDLPFEQSAGLRREATKKGIDMPLFITPTTTKEKMKTIADASKGFLYLISSTGVTGARSAVNAQVEFLLKDIKEVTKIPVSVGFGISKPEHVEQLSSWGADGVIVGSAIVKMLGEAKSEEEGLRNVDSYAKSLVAALPSGHHPVAVKECYPTANIFEGRRRILQAK